jgi:N-acetylglutamate synthase
MLNNPIDIEAIERCTIAAVAPQSVRALPGWLLPMDSGSIGRAHSAVPLSHGAACADLQFIGPIMAQYAQHGRQAKFRLPDIPACAPFIAALQQLGYTPAFPTLMQVGTASGMRALATLTSAQMADTPDEDWIKVFAKGGQPSADDLGRVANFRRGAGAVFASVRSPQDGAVAAGGAAAFGHGWACIHGVNTLASYRGQGLAGQVLAGLANEALERGVDKVMLQVEEDNTSALALYRRAGFSTAWKYVYWQLPVASETVPSHC